jgi:hypothetical protein
MSTREKQLSLVTRTRAVLADATGFDAPQKWVSNGVRGFRHADPRCRKISRTANRVDVTETFEAAVTKNVCPDCFEGGVAASADVPRQLLAAVLKDSRAVDDAWFLIESGERVGSQFRALLSLREAVTSINSHMGRHECPQVAEYVSDLLVRADAGIAAARKQASERRGELVDKVVVDAMAGPTYGASPLWLATPEEAELLGDTTHVFSRTERLSGMYRAWSRAVDAGEGLPAARQSALDSASEFSLRHPAQLSQVPATLGAGENLLVAATAAWEKARTAAVDTMVGRWESQFDQAASQDELTLVAVTHLRWSTSGLPGQVVEAFTVAEDRTGKLRVLRVPAVVANWLSSQDFTAAHGQRVSSVQDAGADHDDKVADTALALWDPHDRNNSQFATFTACIDSAVALMA